VRPIATAFAKLKGDPPKATERGKRDRIGKRDDEFSLRGRVDQSARRDLRRPI